MKQVYLVPVYYEMYGHIPVTADSPEDALAKAEQDLADLPLPDNGEYVEGSFGVDREGAVLTAARTEAPKEAVPQEGTVYEITYDLYLDTGDSEVDEHNLTERFTGSWQGLQERIAQMKQNGCYHISAAALHTEGGTL